ncbi:kinase-like protein, partial [Marasmius fiardii PR-910]
FYKETLLWNQLNHPNLLPFLGVTTVLLTGKVALVSPWMVNGPITNFLKLKPRHDRLKVLLEIIAGITYLHSHNIVHGDIKGANVLVDEYGQCYLGDFGLAITSFTTILLNSTTSGIVKGTTRWMAPELFTTSEDSELVSSTEQVCAKSSKHNTTKLARDIYAFACTTYEIIAGEPPFSQLTDVQVMFKVLGGERPQRPSSVSWCP